jgi:hypothetical protein
VSFSYPLQRPLALSTLLEECAIIQILGRVFGRRIFWNPTPLSVGSLLVIELAVHASSECQSTPSTSYEKWQLRWSDYITVTVTEHAVLDVALGSAGDLKMQDCHPWIFTTRNRGYLKHLRCCFLHWAGGCVCSLKRCYSAV